MSIRFNVTGIGDIDEVIKTVDNYNKKVQAILNGHLVAHNLTLGIRKVAKDEIKRAGFSEKRGRITYLLGGKAGMTSSATGLRVERGLDFTKTNRTFVADFGDDIIDYVFHNTDWNGQKREGLTGGEMINFFENERRAYKIPKNPKGSGVLKFLNNGSGRQKGKYAFFKYTPNKQAEVPSMDNTVDFEHVIRDRLYDVFTSVEDKIANLPINI